MDDADWAEIEAAMAYERSLPDGRIEDVGLTGWQALLDPIAARGWRSFLRTDDGPIPTPTDAAGLFAFGDHHPTLMVWPHEGMQVNVFVYGPDAIDLDVESTEVVGVRALGDLLTDIGRALARPVVLSLEGAPELVLLRYDPTTDSLSPS